MIAIAVLAGCASLPAQPPHDYVARVEVLALLQTLNADLLSHDSATLTLERWCREHALADPARIVARRVRDIDKPVPAELRTQLAIGADEPLGYRHVQLACGDRVLSEADNWYVPGRLTAEMNRQLENSDMPFGRVVQPLGIQRHTISAELLWSPLPERWDAGDRNTDAGALLHIPREVLRHVAVLYSAKHEPYSVVVETYRGELFAFGRWSAFGDPR